MAGDIEGIGDIVTGGLAAAAVSRGGRQSHARHSADADIEHGLCLNCGTHLTGDYCVSCGQSAHIHRSMGAFFHDLLHGVLHFEGKTWRTLPLLAWRPGELTRRYIHGERARFVSPMALFLFAVFLLFGVASFAGDDPDLSNVSTNFDSNMIDAVQTLNTRIERLETDIASQSLSDDALAEARRDLVAAQRERAEVMQGYRALSGKTDAKAEDLGKKGGELSDFVAGVNEGFSGASETERPASQSAIITTSPDALERANRSWLGRKFVKGVEKARANPSLVFYKVKTNAYKFGWMLIPLSVPFVWLAMAGPGMRQWRLYDHVIFTTYSIAFMMLLLIALIVCALIGVSTGVIATIAVFYPPFHMYRQLRGTYRLGRLNALVRTAALLAFSLFALVVFIALLVTAGLIA